MPTLPHPARVLATSWLLVAAALANAETLLTGRVVGVSDGDTITVLSPALQQHRVRLAEIDAPEKAQPYGQRAKQSLSGLVYGQTVTVAVEDTDRYGRLVGQVELSGTNINALQVERGMAWVYRQYARHPALLEAEARARAARLGLWADPAPTPPWDFRRQRRTATH